MGSCIYRHGSLERVRDFYIYLQVVAIAIAFKAVGLKDYSLGKKEIELSECPELNLTATCFMMLKSSRPGRICEVLRRKSQ